MLPLSRDRVMLCELPSYATLLLANSKLAGYGTESAHMTMKPFRDGDTFSTFRALLDSAIREIEDLENDYLLKASPTELEHHFISKVMVEPLRLDAEHHHIEEQTGTRVDVSRDFDRGGFPGERVLVKGTSLQIAIPYTGAKSLWRIRPSTFSLSPYPEINVRDDVVTFSTTFIDDSANAERIKSEIQSAVAALASAVANLGRDVEKHNAEAPSQIKAALARKRAKAETAVNAVAALGIPMRHRDQPLTFVAPTRRRATPVNRPPVAKEKFQPEPVLAQKEYEHILAVLKSMSLVIERIPDTFTSLDEEAIRTHFLLQLNGHYEGSATGETFNASGKTDILIRVDNRTIFVAECKFWRGPKSFVDAIDQLLGYLSWRDSKCALLVFNQTKNSSAVRAKMHELILGRPEYWKTVTHDPNGDARYIFVKPSDPGREIQICTMLFDVPNPNAKLAG